jgi:hypothetical protein
MHLSYSNVYFTSATVYIVKVFFPAPAMPGQYIGICLLLASIEKEVLKLTELQYILNAVNCCKFLSVANKP